MALKPSKKENSGPKAKNGEEMVQKITLKELNPHLLCVLCRGYFIDPVTIVECLHSFCKTCIVEHIKLNKHCPVCDTQINKTKPYLSMRLDKALQNIVYKLVPGLYQDEMVRRRKFTEKNEPTKVPKEELEKHFFFCDDRISMSLEYYDTEKSKNNNQEDKGSNPNKRYLACPGTVKIQHLMKFITMKYGLNSDSFVVDVIYKGDIIPQDYTLIDVAYYYKWEKDSPMQFFYRIFKKSKVLLKRRKRKSKSEDKITDGKKPRTVECSNTSTKSDKNLEKNNVENSGKTNNNNEDKDKKSNPDLIGARTVNSSPPALKDETKKSSEQKLEKLENKDNKKSPPPPVLKPVNNKKIDTETEDDSDDDDKPPSEKKLRIDESAIPKSPVPPKISPKLPVQQNPEPIKIKVSVNDIKKLDNVEHKVEKVEKKMEDNVKLEESKKVIEKPKSPLGTSKITAKNMLTDIVNNLAKKAKDSKTISPPSSLLGGQTTITKKEEEKKIVEKPKVEQNGIKKKEESSVNKPKGIPSGTSVTVKNISKSSPNSTKNSTATVSFSNSFKSKNGSSSMMDLIQDSSKSEKKSTLSDLRQFRKDSSSTKTPQNGKSPIIPSLTLGNNRKNTQNPVTTSSSSSPYSGVLSKPLPKPGEASSATSFLAQANNLSALAALGLGLTDEQQKAFFRNMAAAAMLPTSLMNPGINSVTQQLPSNRLKLTMQSQKPQNPLQMLPPSLASHVAPESQWKMFSNLNPTTTANQAMGASSSPSSSSKFGSLSKTLNQSIRQIPNPSLLTKQANDQQQQILQRAIASQVAAATMAANARTSLSQ